MRSILDIQNMSTTDDTLAAPSRQAQEAPQAPGARQAQEAPQAPEAEAKQPGLPNIDVNEYGGKKEGVRQSMNRRLFMQLLVFDVPAEFKANDAAAELGKLLRARKIPGVVYADTMSPRGLGLLTWGEDPGVFVRDVRPLFATETLQKVTLRPAMGMIGRTYSTGHEPD